MRRAPVWQAHPCVGGHTLTWWLSDLLCGHALDRGCDLVDPGDHRLNHAGQIGTVTYRLPVWVTSCFVAALSLWLDKWGGDPLDLCHQSTWADCH